jgi:hypothetical protein
MSDSSVLEFCSHCAHGLIAPDADFDPAEYVLSPLATFSNDRGNLGILARKAPAAPDDLLSPAFAIALTFGAQRHTLLAHDLSDLLALMGRLQPLLSLSRPI